MTCDGTDNVDGNKVRKDTGAAATQCICKDGFYMNTTTYQCVACNANCATCKTNATTCVTCKAGFRLKADNTCECDTGYYSDGAGSCPPCDPSCNTCDGSGNKACTSCKTNATK